MIDVLLYRKKMNKTKQNVDKLATIMSCCCGGMACSYYVSVNFVAHAVFSAGVSQMSTVRKSYVMLLRDCNGITEWQTATEAMQ